MPQEENRGKPFIKYLRLRGIRCFEDVEIDFSSPSGVRNFSLILGNNGVGKTTLLRCLALGVCDRSSAAALERELYGDLVRQGPSKQRRASIEIQLGWSNSTGKTTIKTCFKKDGAGYSTVSQKVSPKDNLLWNDLFVCGYGAARRTLDTKDLSEYGVVEAVYTLFNYDAALQNPELVLRRLSSVSEDFLKATLHRVDDILLLPKGSTKLTTTGLTVSGPWGTFMPVGSLGDGYQATMAWILDFIGQAMLFEPETLGSDLSGIVLLDEIEQHLHPIWQREIVQRLFHQFPNVQFICTSHSPLCAGGAADISSDSIRLVTLIDQGKCGVKAIDVDPPKGLRIDQIVTSLAFGVSSSRSLGTEHELKEFRSLYRKPHKSPQDTERLEELTQRLETEKPEVAEDEDDRKIRVEVREILRNLKISLNKNSK